MKKSIFILLIIVSFEGCTKDNTFDNSSKIIGDWSWLNTCNGSGTWCWTPASTLTSKKIVFTMDSIYNFYQNDTLESSTKFHTYCTISDNGRYTIYTIKYDSGSWGIFSISHDTLTLIDESGVTFFTSRYKRIK